LSNQVKSISEKNFPISPVILGKNINDSLTRQGHL